MDHVLKYLKENNIPVTRENYLEIAYMGNPPEVLGAEEEAALPQELQLQEDTEEE